MNSSSAVVASRAAAARALSQLRLPLPLPSSQSHTNTHQPRRNRNRRRNKSEGEFVRNASALECATTRRQFSTGSIDNAPRPAPNVARPVLTFLSPNPSASRAAVGFLDGILSSARLSSPSLSPIEAAASLDDGAPSEFRDRDDGPDVLDELFFGPSSGGGSGGMRWDSVASSCPKSGAVLHFLSPSSSLEEYGSQLNNDNRTALSPHGLLSLSVYKHPAFGYDDSHADEKSMRRAAVAEARQRLAKAMINRKQMFLKDEDEDGILAAASMDNATRLRHRLKGYGMRFLLALGRPVTPSFVLGGAGHPGGTGGDMLVDLPPFSHSSRSTVSGAMANDESKGGAVSGSGGGRLREIVLPFFREGSSLQSALSKSGLSRPLPGLYQFSESGGKGGGGGRRGGGGGDDDVGAVLRPIPAADEDIRLPPPSLVFRCTSLDDARASAESAGCAVAKVGWRGSRRGQLAVLHPALAGLDVRLCESAKLSSTFDEAQEALLAGSLGDLQSAHVESEGDEKGENKYREKKSGGSSDGDRSSSEEEGNTRSSDARNGLGDCWVEFRSNVKNPSGFWKGRARRWGRQLHVAKSPSMPYE